MFFALCAPIENVKVYILGISAINIIVYCIQITGRGHP